MPSTSASTTISGGRPGAAVWVKQVEAIAVRGTKDIPIADVAVFIRGQ